MTAEFIDPKLVSLLWAGPSHAGEVAKIHGQLFNQAWDEEGVAALLDHPASTAFIATVGGPPEAVGFIMAQLAADEAEILSIGVLKPWQKRGVGQLLVEGLARAAKRAEVNRIVLDVAADNDGAMALYLKLGFVGVGLRRGYYERADGPPVDSLTMALTLSSDGGG